MVWQTGIEFVVWRFGRCDMVDGVVKWMMDDQCAGSRGLSKPRSDQFTVRRTLHFAIIHPEPWGRDGIDWPENRLNPYRTVR